MDMERHWSTLMIRNENQAQNSRFCTSQRYFLFEIIIHINQVYRQGRSLTNQCTRIAAARFFNDYLLAKKWVIVATFASPQSRDFSR